MTVNLGADSNQNQQKIKTSSQEALKNLLGNIEGELYHSEVYHQTLVHLQNPQGAKNTPRLLQALVREAIGLALKTFIKQYRASHPQAPEKPSPSPPQNPLTTVFKPFVSSHQSHRQKQQPKAEDTNYQRIERLQKIGQELRQAREAKFVSLQQLHQQTLVPLPHLEALESGQIDRLPEDVYVRGFVRRLGDALGLNGSAMATSIPVSDSVKTIMPTWERLPSNPNLQLRTGHLYIGYAALMAGAVSGLSLLSTQSNTSGSHEPETAENPTTPISQTNPREVPVKKPGINSNKIGLATTEIAPPEVVNNH